MSTVKTEPIAALNSSDITEGRPSAARRWSIIIVLMFGAVIAYISRTNIATALVVKDFIQKFNLSDIDRGTLNSAFFWAYAALQIPTGWIVDRYGVKMPYAISFLFWCICSAATGVANSLGMVTGLRILTGAGEAIVTPASYRWIRYNFQEKEAGTAIGVYMFGTKIGPAIGPPLAAWLITTRSWQTMFIVLGLAGLVWLIPWMLLVKNDSPSAEKRAAVDKPKKKPTVKIPMKNIFRSPVVWGTIIINFCYNYFVFYCMTWMPAYLVETRHMSLNKMGLYSFFSFSGIAIVTLASGWAADMLIKRGWDAVIVRKSFIIAGFAIACTELLGVRASSVNEAVFWAIVSLSGLGLASANHLALCRLTLIPAAAVGLVSGIQNTATSLAGIVGPIISGWLKQTSGGYEAPMLVIFAFLVLGGLTCLVMLRPKWSPKVEVAAEA
jgi:sugar phosphate permease